MADDDPSPREPRDATMQRVRVGLTGLAAVFLLTLLAASILGMFGQGDLHGSRLANGAAAANSAAEQPAEPLAELGIAPGGSPDKTTPTTPVAKPRAPAPAPHPAAAPLANHR